MGSAENSISNVVNAPCVRFYYNCEEEEEEEEDYEDDNHSTEMLEDMIPGGVPDGGGPDPHQDSGSSQASCRTVVIPLVPQDLGGARKRCAGPPRTDGGGSSRWPWVLPCPRQGHHLPTLVPSVVSSVSFPHHGRQLVPTPVPASRPRLPTGQQLTKIKDADLFKNVLSLPEE